MQLQTHNSASFIGQFGEALWETGFQKALLTRDEARRIAVNIAKLAA
jgi:hypothetical protein